MADLLDEVKQELKEEQFIKLGKTLAPYALTIMLSIIVGVSAKLWWTDYRNDKIYQAGADYQMAVLKMRAMNTSEAEVRLRTLIDNNGTVYTSLAQLSLAAFQDFKGNHSDAYQLYKKASSTNNKSQVTYDLAKFLELKASISANTTENEALNEYVDDDAVFASSANDLIVGSEFSTGDSEKIKSRINLLLTDTSTPVSIRERIKVMNSYLEVKKF